jgi:hypothetical protein
MGLFCSIGKQGFAYLDTKLASSCQPSLNLDAPDRAKERVETKDMKNASLCRFDSHEIPCERHLFCKS